MIKLETSLNYKSYEVPSARSIQKIKYVLWRGLLHCSEGEGKNKRFFIRTTEHDVKRIKKHFPFMKIKEIQE